MTGTREVILETAERLFAEKGFAATSIRDIVGEAQTSPPSLYHFFGSKENLLVELVTDRYATYCDALESELQKADTAEDVSRQFVKFVLGNMVQKPASAKFMFSIMFGPQQDIPRDELSEMLLRSEQIVHERLHAVCKGAPKSRIAFARTMLLGMVTPAVLMFLTSGTTAFSSKLPSCIGHRVADMLTDDHPVCSWPDMRTKRRTNTRSR